MNNPSIVLSKKINQTKKKKKKKKISILGRTADYGLDALFDYSSLQYKTVLLFFIYTCAASQSASVVHSTILTKFDTLNFHQERDHASTSPVGVIHCVVYGIFTVTDSSYPCKNV